MTSWRQPSIVRASNHALVARSSNTTASVSQSHRRREEELMGPSRVNGVSSDPPRQQLGVKQCALALGHETRGQGSKPAGEFAWSVRRRARGQVGFDFGEGFAAALANRRIARVLPDVPRVVPAALASLPVRALNLDGQARQDFAWHKPIAFGGIDYDLRHDKK